jgi:hypothetical protein
MADNLNELENVRCLVTGNQFSPNQLGIDLIQQSSYKDNNDPIIEAVVVSRRMSGLIEIEMSITRRDSLAKMSEHVALRSNFESAIENERLIYEDEQDD